ncbi:MULTISPECIES: hypothetical protein [unclassified Sphingopyxis]|uniref:hypothetical protein n=1 Tax=unclassified Sphingopyxis TaxID=2614943 RepID=UPI00073647B1|nr:MULTISPECIES: hypothetical protein [unclassified Sphingopyxis]KTE39797.1 hypothetical protein ATE62_08695 [Sphingopyxis sp. HIX]KTE84844.1 hypothetical protein ATE72_06660 [Sphingopyxis sp. HXXIV]
MTNDNTSKPPTGLGVKLLHLLQGVMFMAVLLLGISNIIHFKYRGLDGFPEALFWSLLGLSAVLSASHFPAVFFRSPRKWQVGVYVAIIPFLVLMGTVGSQSVAAFHRTPEGKAEMAKQEAADALAAKEAEERAATKRVLAEAEQTRADLATYEEKLEGCFSSWDHRIGDLEDELKGSLHNPDAFQHIETLAIVTDSAGNNVAMRFRAENGFGALRAATVKARINVNDCSVVSVGEPTVAE